MLKEFNAQFEEPSVYHAVKCWRLSTILRILWPWGCSKFDSGGSCLLMENSCCILQSKHLGSIRACCNCQIDIFGAQNLSFLLFHSMCHLKNRFLTFPRAYKRDRLSMRAIIYGLLWVWVAKDVKSPLWLSRSVVTPMLYTNCWCMSVLRNVLELTVRHLTPLLCIFAAPAQQSHTQSHGSMTTGQLILWKQGWQSRIGSLKEGPNHLSKFRGHQSLPQALFPVMRVMNMP